MLARCYDLDLWQMLLPFNVLVLWGRWKATGADVMALCVEQVADFIATGDKWNIHPRVDFVLIFNFWGVKQSFIPYVRQMVFANVFV